MVFDGCFELAIGNIEWFDHFSSQFWTKIASVIFLFAQFQLLIDVILFKSQTKKIKFKKPDSVVRFFNYVLHSLV